MEGLSYLVILAGFGVLCYQIYDKGFVPSALPSGACYGDQPIEPLDLSAILASIKEGAQPLTEQAGPGMQKVRDQSQALVDSLPTQAELQAAVESAWQAAMAQAGSLREAAKPAMDEAMASVQKLKDQLPTKAEVRAAAESTTTAVKAQADSLKAAAQAAKEQAVDVARQMALQMKEWIPTMPDINSRIK